MDILSCLALAICSKTTTSPVLGCSCEWKYAVLDSSSKLSSIAYSVSVSFNMLSKLRWSMLFTGTFSNFPEVVKHRRVAVQARLGLELWPWHNQACQVRQMMHLAFYSHTIFNISSVSVKNLLSSFCLKHQLINGYTTKRRPASLQQSYKLNDLVLLIFRQVFIYVMYVITYVAKYVVSSNNPNTWDTFDPWRNCGKGLSLELQNNKYCNSDAFSGQQIPCIAKEGFLCKCVQRVIVWHSLRC